MQEAEEELYSIIGPWSRRRPHSSLRRLLFNLKIVLRKYVCWYISENLMDQDS